MFLNVITNKMSNQAVQLERGRWYIRCGFCGFNSPTNNGLGYASRKKAEAAIIRYQNKKPR